MIEEFLRTVRGDKTAVVVFRLGTVDPAYASGRPKITFDGEDSLSTKLFPYLSSYTPAANDRVLIAVLGFGSVVVGKIV